LAGHHRVEPLHGGPEGRCREECRIERPGFRVRCLVIATTLLNADEYSKDDLAQADRARCNEELDLRSIKVTMQMDLLRCKTPELVRKETWTHVLAYNLIRTIMAQMASQYRIAPRTISFKATIQILQAFQSVIAHRGDLDKTMACLAEAEACGYTGLCPWAKSSVPSVRGETAQDGS
jgi:hypothetical protein